MARVCVSISVAGTWPSREELTMRNAVTDALDAAEIGKCTGAGGGRGEMDFSYRVSDEQAAREAIVAAMQSLMPGAQYRIRVSE